ncbi:hypothetical protein DERF_004529 [Dermatophagoides farinae]|uniref:Uncharacterized protein n=1 Tax=Dermatophagoides farinae TaxID=6954 RepID=A0A922I500_DERFA|nr:hypothetical protein DERF_004529 [Dermatophagoides farinae]
MINKQSNSMRTIRSPSPSPSPSPPPPSSIPSESFQIPMHENPNIDDDDIFYRLNNNNRNNNSSGNRNFNDQGWKPSNLKKNLMIEKQQQIQHHHQQQQQQQQQQLQQFANKNEAMIPIIKANDLFSTPILQRSNDHHHHGGINHSVSMNSNSDFGGNNHHNPAFQTSSMKLQNNEDLHFLQNNRKLWNHLTSSSISNDVLDNELNQIQSEMISKYKTPMKSMNSLGKQIAMFLLNRNQNPTPANMANNNKQRNYAFIKSMTPVDGMMDGSNYGYPTLPISSSSPPPARYDTIIVDDKSGQQLPNGKNYRFQINHQLNDGDTKTTSTYRTNNGQSLQTSPRTVFTTVPFVIDLSSTAIKDGWPSLVKNDGSEGGGVGVDYFDRQQQQQQQYQQQQQHPIQTIHNAQRPRTSATTANQLIKSLTPPSVMSNEPTNMIFMPENLANPLKASPSPMTAAAAAAKTSKTTTTIIITNIDTTAFIPIQSTNSILFEPSLITNNNHHLSVDQQQQLQLQQQQQQQQQQKQQQKNEQFNWSPEIKNVVLKMELPIIPLPTPSPSLSSVNIDGNGSRRQSSQSLQNYHYVTTYNNQDGNPFIMNYASPKPPSPPATLSSNHQYNDGQLSPYNNRIQTSSSTAEYRIKNSNYNYKPQQQQQQQQSMNIYNSDHSDHLDHWIDIPNHHHRHRHYY